MKNWGPYFWGTLHIACLTAPPVLSEQHKIAFEALVQSFTFVLPCPVCQMHFREILNKFPIQNRTRTELFIWSVQVHNEVNKSLGKPLVDPQEAFEYWAVRTNYEETFPVQDALIILALVLAISFLLLK
jgi:FAD-linked sulfhydryl oxidase